MSWFAICAGSALVVLAVIGFMGKITGSIRVSRPNAVVIGFIGLLFLFLGGALEGAQ
ncbi:MAG TPA: hypothetical protein VFH89_07675 [Sphingomicrobium sp.]|nr:hypothetical protein [Sphingomicrobium sp.]